MISSARGADFRAVLQANHGLVQRKRLHGVPANDRITVLVRLRRHILGGNHMFRVVDESTDNEGLFLSQHIKAQGVPHREAVGLGKFLLHPNPAGVPVRQRRALHALGHIDPWNAVKGVDGWSSRVADTRLDERIRHPEIEEDRIFGVSSAEEAMALLEKYIPLYEAGSVYTGIRPAE